MAYTGANSQTYQEYLADQKKMAELMRGYNQVVEAPQEPGQSPTPPQAGEDGKYRYGGNTGFGEAVTDFWTPQGLAKDAPKVPKAPIQQPAGQPAPTGQQGTPPMSQALETFRMDDPEGYAAEFGGGQGGGQGDGTKQFGGKSGLGEAAFKAMTLGKG